MFHQTDRHGHDHDGYRRRPRACPPRPCPASRCAVPECRCVPTVRGAVLCEPHAATLPQQAHPDNRRAVRASSAGSASPAIAGMLGCGLHPYRRRGDRLLHHPLPAVARGPAERSRSRRTAWRATESGVAEPGQVNLRALPELVVVEVLVGVQTRLRDGCGSPTSCCGRSATRCVATKSPRSSDCEPSTGTRQRARSVLASFARDARRMLADPGSEQAKDTWDLAVFGHPGRLSFTAITQPWLAGTAKRWAAEQLPRHRGSGAARVRGKINNIGMLSEHLARRPDHGLIPRRWAARDLEGFLNRLGHLESTGRIGRYRRNMICRDVRQVLAGIRSLGLTRPGQPAAGLPGDFAIERRRHPRRSRTR